VLFILFSPGDCAWCGFSYGAPSISLGPGVDCVMRNNFGAAAADDIYSISASRTLWTLAPFSAQKDPSTQSEMIAAHCSARTIVDGAESLQIMARSFVGPRLAHTRCTPRRERLFVAEIRANAASLRNSGRFRSSTWNRGGLWGFLMSATNETSRGETSMVISRVYSGQTWLLTK
jgi:hypothetical protein